ncbi:MAG TPA: hypothetical protein DCQ98_21570 [Planctomycetaceae bacterium]|nr:hypothetical protein [Planctomycetaceae bacterium]
MKRPWALTTALGIGATSIVAGRRAGRSSYGATEIENTAPRRSLPVVPRRVSSPPSHSSWSGPIISRCAGLRRVSSGEPDDVGMRLAFP